MTLRLLRIAFRNLLRARRRNALTGGTMALGAIALVLGSGLSDGIARQLTRSLVGVQTGHLQVVVRPPDFQPQNSPFDAYGQDRLPEARRLARSIEALPGVQRAAPFLYVRGSAITGSRSTMAQIVGIEPERQPELREAHPPEAGVFLPEGDDFAVYVASPMARKLRLSPGDSVSFVIQTPQGAVNTFDGVVCGIFRKGAPWLSNTFYVSLGAAQSLLDWPDGATNVKITLADGSRAGAHRSRPAVARVVAGIAPAARVETFDEAGRFYFAIIQANESALLVLSAFLFLAAAVGVVNGMLMSVRERTREIGTVRALGMRRGLVVRLFLLEGFALGLVSAVLGITLGGAVVLYLAAKGIPMNTFTLAWIAGGDRLFPALLAPSVGRALVAITLLSTASAVYPAFSASRLEPREALHHV